MPQEARIELIMDFTWQMPPMQCRRRGGLMQPVTSVAKAAGKRLLRASTRKFDFRHYSAEGFIDFRRRRYMLDYGSYALLYAGAQVARGGRVAGSPR